MKKITIALCLAMALGIHTPINSNPRVTKAILNIAENAAGYAIMASTLVTLGCFLSPYEQYLGNDFFSQLLMGSDKRPVIAILGDPRCPQYIKNALSDKIRGFAIESAYAGALFGATVGILSELSKYADTADNKSN